MNRFPMISSGLVRPTLAGLGRPASLRRDGWVAPAAGRRVRVDGLLRAVAHGLIVGGMFITGYVFLVLAPNTGTFGYDAFAYWNVAAGDPYAVPLG